MPICAICGPPSELKPSVFSVSSVVQKYRASALLPDLCLFVSFVVTPLPPSPIRPLPEFNETPLEHCAFPRYLTLLAF